MSLPGIRILIQLIRAFEQLLLRWYYNWNPPPPPPPACPIPWRPNALAPVFYGVRDYDGSQGMAPAPCRVYFPSLDGSVFTAPVLDGCGRYPLILFAHGSCPKDKEHYRLWYQLPAQLARSGCVVTAPELPDPIDPSADRPAALSVMTNIIAWMRESWEHRNVLLPSPATGVIGHSFGAVLGARFAGANAVSAYVSIAGTWWNWPAPPLPIQSLQMPMLFCYGTGDTVGGMDEPVWNSLALPKHRAIFAGGGHWDYLPPGTSLCDDKNQRGPCMLTGTLTADLVTMFFGRYLPPETLISLPISPSLIPPDLSMAVMTFQQQFYAGAYLGGFQQLGGSRDCSVTLAWETAIESGTISRP